MSSNIFLDFLFYCLEIWRLYFVPHHATPATQYSQNIQVGKCSTWGKVYNLVTKNKDFKITLFVFKLSSNFLHITGVAHLVNSENLVAMVTIF